MDRKGKNRDTAFRRKQFYKYRNRTRDLIKNKWGYKDDEKITEEDIELMVRGMEKNRTKCSCHLCSSKDSKYKPSEQKQLDYLEYEAEHELIDRMRLCFQDRNTREFEYEKWDLDEMSEQIKKTNRK